MSLLDGSLTSLAFCWRLERRDGVTIGLTAHDRDLMVDGLIYRAAPGMVPSAIAQSDGLAADTLDVKGAFTSDAIAAADMEAGRWDGAALRLFVTDWEQPGEEALELAHGTLGDVTIAGAAFTVELKGATAGLDAPVAEQTSPTCRAMLGDGRCRVAMRGRRRLARVTAVSGETGIAIDASESVANGWGGGMLRWLSGGNCGLIAGVASSSGTSVRLREAPLVPVAAGDLIEIEEGCDKRFETCTGRFGNGANFRGEPHLPGMDLLTRYPGA